MERSSQPPLSSVVPLFGNDKGKAYTEHYIDHKGTAIPEAYSAPLIVVLVIEQKADDDIFNVMC